MNFTNQWEYLSIGHIETFAKHNVSFGYMVLDVGAGANPYAKLFKGCVYHTADMVGNHTYNCDIAKMPIKDSSYDVALCTAVLEHVIDPDAVIVEIYRVLKDGGKLLITVPQCIGEHSPYNYFNFVRGGIEHLLNKNGFIVNETKPLGGIFELIGCIVGKMPWYIYRQCLGEPYISLRAHWRLTIKAILLAPFFIVLLPICRYLVSLLCKLLDKLDKRKAWTIGYCCVATK